MRAYPLAFVVLVSAVDLFSEAISVLDRDGAGIIIRAGISDKTVDREAIVCTLAEGPDASSNGRKTIAALQGQRPGEER